MIAAQRFQELRPYLFSIAYRMLGSASEAEDAIQDAWLRTDKAPEQVESEKAWLSTIVTRICLDRLKSAQSTREEYVGPWLPEPVLTNAIAPDAHVMEQESITLAFLVLLERLSPAERAAFLLREIFDYEYAEVARIVGASDAAVRQLVHRAKERIAQGRRRFESDPQRQGEVVNRFLAAAREGELAGLEAMLAADARFVADGGGKVAAARRIVDGANAVARVFAGIYAKASSHVDKWRAEVADVNSEPALLAYFEDKLDTVFIFSVYEDLVQSIQVIRNPEKLAWLHARLAAERPN
jgi:RNA polymerase sigma-70 factor (TIGR02957 family)